MRRCGASAQARRPLPRRCQRPSCDQRTSSYIRNSDTMFKRVAASPPGSDPRAGGPPFSYHAQVRRPRAQCPGQNRDVDQSLAATVGLQGGLIPRGASAPGDRPVARHRCGYRVILRESPLFLTRIIFKVPRRPLLLIIGPAGVSWRVLSRTSRF